MPSLSFGNGIIRGMENERYRDIYDGYRWNVPGRFNIGVDICDRVAAHSPGAPALIWEGAGGDWTTLTFGWLREQSNRLANGLVAHGLRRGDRVAVLLGQCPETAVAHIGILKAGLISVPLFTAFGESALAYRIEDSGARAIVTDSAQLPKVLGLRNPNLELILCVGGKKSDAVSYADFLDRASPAFSPVDTAADDPALIIYTSGTTGAPKGALHAHRMLIGHDPGIEFVHFGMKSGGAERFWSPQDWAWVAGLVNILFCALRRGIPVIAADRRFDPEWAWHLLERRRPTRVFIPPTAVHQMCRLNPSGRRETHLQSIGTGGETLSPEILGWADDVFGVPLNEAFGQTECNMIVGNSAAVMPVKRGSMGRAMPGHTVSVVDSDGQPAPGTGIVAVRRGDPVMFLEYWKEPQATAEKFAGEWLLTGDLARQDGDGYLFYVGRADDVINTAGYRVGPTEIEEALMSHQNVAAAGVIGVPDSERGQAIKAFIELSVDAMPSEALAEELRAHVKARLARHLYPRAIEFIAEMPRTVTGKVRRRDLRERRGGR